jgi:hypothetical protein
MVIFVYITMTTVNYQQEFTDYLVLNITDYLYIFM